MFKDIWADPVGVGSRFALRAGHTDHELPIKAVGEYRPIGCEPIQLFEVCAVPVVLKQGEAMYGAARFTVRVREKSAVGGDITACYLPWGAHETYRVSLKKIDEKVGLFFTAPLDGCAVIVEGTCEAPVVYHANANGVEPEASPMGDRDVLEPVAIKLLEKRNEAMFAACRAFPGDLDSFSDALNSGAITPLEYGVLIGRPSEQAEKQALRRNLDQPEWFARTGWKTKPQDLTFTKSFGAVFGVRKSGRWTFYRQKIVDLNGSYLVLSCSEFWPSGFRR
jgi:hypothetical protein